MPFEHTLINLKRELIRTFAVVDEWFDKAHTLRSYKPADGGWGVSEVLEHIMLTNHFLLIVIEKGTLKALKKSENIDGKFIVPEDYVLATPGLLQIGDPNAFEWQRPEHHQPTGSQSLHDVRREIRDQLDQCLITLELLQRGEGILHHTTMSVNSLGKLDVYQYVYFLALHAQRHLIQMKNIEQEFEKCLSV
ncbi:DinB family protein [Chryseolinea sp. H1M3-3]|uniref:DinB family protein n=1 Tax=Chryseolinea sp. H1M3-3 TaxID=3034144 RepID=UPI0023EB04D9|nr:DinB family protein [Chryseolinea sp. H1M3-3]